MALAEAVEERSDRVRADGLGDAEVLDPLIRTLDSGLTH
jgi:hypothetical protein